MFIDVCFNVYLDFREGRTPILVATDVAARGLGKLHVFNLSKQ